MANAVLSIDAGTTNVRSLIVGIDGRVLGQARVSQTLLYPLPGLVEMDAEELWRAAQQTIEQALSQAGLAAKDLAAVGITGQRTTIIVWDRKTGRAIGPGISWQDQRGARRANELLAQGFFVNAIAASSKLESVLDAIPDGRSRMAKGELAWGNVDSFLAWKLSGGSAHVTDCSQACTTGYYDYFTGKWDSKLIDFQGLDLSLFPEIVDTSAIIGNTDRKVLGVEIPIGAIIGDQQSAAYAQGCLQPGEGKVTYGTSATCNVNTGCDINLNSLDAGIFPLVLWRRNREVTFCLEGMVITAGAVFSWLERGLKLLKNASAAADVGASVPDSNGVFFLPALQGLGSPHGQAKRYGVISGLTLGVTEAHIVRAAMEGVAFRVREMIDRVYADSTVPRPASIRVDGGAAANDVLMQIQADILGCPLERMTPLEATGFGAALLAGEACGIWPAGSMAVSRQTSRTFEPEWNEELRDERFEAWRIACKLIADKNVC
jgi:glycerol kinase